MNRLNSVDINTILGRNFDFFREDLLGNFELLEESFRGTRVLIIGGGGSIGRAIAKSLLDFEIKTLFLVDLSENSLVEITRTLRSDREINFFFDTFAVDALDDSFSAFLDHNGPFDFVFNLAAIKHVRSDKDIYSVLRMFKTNIELPAKLAEHDQVGKLFCVSTDKAANPANLMGASKRLMEMRLCALHSRCDITFARFANVAFSDGSLLDGFCKRLSELQPLCFPNNIKRYFVSDRDAATICLLSSVLGQDRDIMFPVMDATLDSYDFRFLAESFLGHMGLTPRYCESEKEARAQMLKISRNWGKEWPCFAFHSDTDGEKGIEEFYTLAEKPNFDRFSKIGVLTLGFEAELDKLKYQHLMNNMNNLTLSISEIRSVVSELVPDYIPIITGRNLNDRM